MECKSPGSVTVRTSGVGLVSTHEKPESLSDAYAVAERRSSHNALTARRTS